MDMRRKILFGIGISATLLLSACSGFLNGNATQDDAALTAETPTAYPVPDMDTNLQESEAVNPATTEAAPLRFDIPTPGAEPISDWRPPLYPVPWAISPHDHFYFIRPIAANEVNWPLASYRYGYVFFRGVVHSGVDIPATTGTPVIAAGNGTVVWAGWGFFSGDPGNQDDPYGQAVVVEHDFGYEGQPLYTIYAHMSRIDAVVGQWLQAGEQIGLVGDTGHTTGPHLHFEVRLGENTFYDTYNPELWIAPPQGWGVLTGFVANYKGEPIRSLKVQVYAYDTGKIRSAYTYGPKVVNGDAYYHENMVLGDLPAGWYEVRLLYEGEEYRQNIEIFPGQVSYFSFKGAKGYSLERPKEKGAEDLIPTPAILPTPTE